MQSFLLCLPIVLALASPSAAAPDARQLMDTFRSALADGRATLPEKIEIDALYHYSDTDEVIFDHTVIEPNRRLYQERKIEDVTIRRAWSIDDAYLEGPQGRMALEPEQQKSLETYLCLRQLTFLILCPDTEARLMPATEDGHLLVEVLRDDAVFAELELNPELHRIEAMRYHEKAGSTIDDGEVASEDLLTEVRFSDYRAVRGWVLPHRVVTRVGGEHSSSYSIERLVVSPE